MTQLVVVCGLPGTGKTTLAQALAARWHWPCFSKDATCKEPLYELLGGSTLEESRRLGSVAIQMLLRMVEMQLRYGVSCIVEAPFQYSEDGVRFAQWAEEYGVAITCVVCTVDEEERLRRFRSRTRHPAHHDADRTPHAAHAVPYHSFPGELIWLDTAQPLEDVIGAVERQVSR
ncbi:ATP-binding protein [Candidatus Uhrbacteria bacterium]|nr:ATP-binding protein [Candidatus Uhrbacteria bacterium]